MPIDNDVFTNPEIYLKSVITSLYLLDSISLFILGYFSYKISGNFLTGLFLQISPFCSYMVISLLNRIIVEHLMISITLILILMVFAYLPTEKIDLKSRVVYILIFSILIGLGTATKITYSPFFFLPLILLPGYFDKAFYSVLSVVFFTLFAMPVFHQWVIFTQWVKNLIIYSGQYGTGAANIIDRHTFITNLHLIFSNEPVYLLALIFLIITCIVYYIPFLKLRQKNDTLFHCLAGIVVTMILMTLLVAKQYKNFYITPAILLSIPGFYISFKLLSRKYKLISKYFFIVPVCIILIGFIYINQFKQIFKYHDWKIDLENKYENSMILEQKFCNKPVLMIADYYGAPFKSYSLFFGSHWIGGYSTDIGKKYSATLEQLYPDHYFYPGWNYLFNHWFDSYSYINLLRKYKTLYLYVGNNETYGNMKPSLNGINRQTDTKVTQIFSNDDTKEKMFEVIFDTSSYTGNQKFICDAELCDNTGNNFIGNKNEIYEYGITRSSEQARSGSYSSKLTRDYPYGMTCNISEVQKGEHYLISIWKYNNNNLNSGLVVTLYNSKELYLYSSVPDSVSNNWQKLSVDLNITDNLNNKTLLIYSWNNDPNLPAYFDDLTIEKK